MQRLELEVEACDVGVDPVDLLAKKSNDRLSLRFWRQLGTPPDGHGHPPGEPGPPEDCGGIPGFYKMLEAQADPEHPEHAEVTEYLEGWDPKEIDELPLRIVLGRIANRRSAAKTRNARKTTS